jgi:uncharacterized cupin superfamily protein
LHRVRDDYAQLMTERWFVVNVADTEWVTTEGGEKQRSGSDCSFERDGVEFEQLGVRIHVLPPGEPNGCYHEENQQEDFLVLSGECLLIVEGEERRLKQWDFFHSPPGTGHIFVGAGDGPCAILMVGARSGEETIRYPVSEVAARHGASVEVETTTPREAYADWEPGRRAKPSFWNELPWA